MEIFSHKYRNIVGDPYMTYMHNRPRRDLNACGLAATGDDTAEPAASDQPEKSNAVVNLQPWRYARTALMLIGVYVLAKFLYEKFKK
jgi:hypothetical protein